MLEQIEDDRQRFVVGDEISLVDFDIFNDRRHAAEADAFGDRAAFSCFCLAVLEQMIHRRAARICHADYNVFFLLSKKRRNARNGAASTNRAYETIDAALALLPDFRTR